ncbi:MAG: hypothetical protein ACRDJU_15425 [Actinomycetota bacterium]
MTPNTLKGQTPGSVGPAPWEKKGALGRPPGGRPLRGSLAAGVIAAAAAAIIAVLVISGRPFHLGTTSTKVPSDGPTDGMETDGFHPPGQKAPAGVVVPVELLNGASVRLVFPSATDLNDFNYDPEGEVVVSGGPGGPVTVLVSHASASSAFLRSPDAKLLRNLSGAGRHTVSLYRFEPAGPPGAQRGEALVFKVGDWYVSVSLPLVSGSTPPEEELQFYADHIGAHQTTGGYPVLDVPSSLTMTTQGSAGLDATLTDWTVLPPGPTGAWLPDKIWLSLSPCLVTGHTNSNGLHVATSDVGALPGVPLPPESRPPPFAATRCRLPSPLAGRRASGKAWPPA